MHTSPTLVARLTPAGTGALAVLGVLGPDAPVLVKSVLTAPRQLSEPFALVRVGPEPGEPVVISADTCNGQPRYEIHCHGGVAVVDSLMELLEQKGARRIDAATWIRLTSPSPLRSAAELALGNARTARVAGVLLDHLHGAGDRVLAEIVDLLDRQEHAAALEAMQELLAWRTFARHLIQPWRVALAGPPNVGKSTLLNALVGFQRAITAPSPGTTRDVVSALTAFDGWPVELLDTAGIRAEAEGLEAEGIERTRALCDDVNLVLWLLDASEPDALARTNFALASEPDALARTNFARASASGSVFVLNKIDLPPAWTPPPDTPMIRVSAKEGVGLAELIEAIVARLVPRVPPAGAGMLVSEDGWEALAKAREALRAGETQLARHYVNTLASSPLVLAAT